MSPLKRGQIKKDRYKNDRVEVLKYLASKTKEDQTRDCDKFLEKMKAAQQVLDNITSEDQVHRKIQYLKNYFQK